MQFKLTRGTRVHVCCCRSVSKLRMNCHESGDASHTDPAKVATAANYSALTKMKMKCKREGTVE